jgi:YD repeat-containing protein
MEENKNLKEIKIMKKYILFSLLFIQCMVGQELPKVVPPSPEAASVFKFSEVPVSLHTGLPSIEIPLYTITSGGVTVPITLSYHARGIKVAEIASRVGLGWTLNAGGMISRQIRDKADGSSGQFNIANTYKNNGDFFTSALKRSAVWNSYSGHSEDYYDFIPDQYYFNTGTGLGGKFIFDYNDGQILAQNYSNVTVNSLQKITDGQGNEFFFEEEGDTEDVSTSFVMEKNHHYTQNSAIGQNGIRNTWHLKKIRTQQGKEIEFFYENELSSYIRRSYDHYEEGNTIAGNSTHITQGAYKCYAAQIQSNQRRIREIKFEEGSIEFQYATESRLDLMYGGNYLKKVILYNKAGEIVKQQVLDYLYTNSSDLDSDQNVNFNLRTLDDEAANRLFLKSVQTIGSGLTDNRLPPYVFEYDATKLPSRHSNSVDVWGYYNGEQNLEFFPESVIGGGTRAVNEVKCGAGLLKKIRYPEGGSVTFNYEQNRVFCNYPKNIIFFDNPNPLQMKTMLLTPLDYSVFDSIRNEPVYSWSDRIYRKAFVISNSCSGSIKFKNISGVPDCGVLNTSSCKFRAQIRRLENDAPVYQFPITTDDLFHEAVTLAPGSYTLTVIPLDPQYDHTNFGEDHPEEYFEVSLEWIEEVAGTQDPIYAGGKRIQKIEYRDSNDLVTMSKTYDYTDPNTGKSSGMLFGLPNFFGIESQSTMLFGESFTISKPFGNVSGAPLSTYQGASLGYGVVTEYLGEGTNTIGKSVHRFTMNPESGDFYTFPYHPSTDSEWMRGKELSVVHFRKNENNTYTPVKMIENEYLYAGNVEENTPSAFYSLSYRKQLNQNLQCAGGDEPIELYCTHSGYLKTRKRFRLPLASIYLVAGTSLQNALRYKVFQLTGGTMDLKSTKTTDYFDGGTERVTTTNYHYRHDYNYALSSKEEEASNWDMTASHFYYATDPDMDGQPNVAMLKDHNVVDVPLKTQTIRSNVPVATTSTLFNERLLPEFIQTAKGTADLETRIHYTRYDAWGNPIELQQENGMVISYIWGYNNSKPIAKIENAAYETIPSDLIQTAVSASNSSQTGTETALLNALQQLRDSLPDSFVSTFTYKPLVGVASITDPGGSTTRYDYDKLGRLIGVYDANDHLLSTTDYHYKSQN